MLSVFAKAPTVLACCRDTPERIRALRGTTPELHNCLFNLSFIISLMQPLKKRIMELKVQIESAYSRLDIKKKLEQAKTLETELGQSGAWSDSSAAQAKSKQLAALQTATGPWHDVKTQIDDLLELVETGDGELEGEVETQLGQLETTFAALKKELRFSGEYDDHGAILRISAGVGGTDAQDWAEMLERMYLRWAEKNGMKSSIVERSSGDEAGLKTSVIEVTGPFAYGKLRSEHGVHRLVRLSPFNSDNLRQTSFALVEVLPQIDTPDEIPLDEKDLKVDVYRAGGHGGQSVNTTDSAVRVTHLPTSITVAIQNERSQLQNKETALKILRSKLAQLKQEQHEDDLARIKGPSKSAEWGSQIRNYVLHPYTIVKDTRTKHEERDAAGVLDGKLDGFIDAYLNLNLS